MTRALPTTDDAADQLLREEIRDDIARSICWQLYRVHRGQGASVLGAWTAMLDHFNPEPVAPLRGSYPAR
jgi:hypothetical protein